MNGYTVPTEYETATREERAEIRRKNDAPQEPDYPHWSDDPKYWAMSERIK